MRSAQKLCRSARLKLKKFTLQSASSRVQNLYEEILQAIMVLIEESRGWYICWESNVLWLYKQDWQRNYSRGQVGEITKQINKLGFMSEYSRAQVMKRRQLVLLMVVRFKINKFLIQSLDNCEIKLIIERGLRNSIVCRSFETSFFSSAHLLDA